MAVQRQQAVNDRGPGSGVAGSGPRPPRLAMRPFADDELVTYVRGVQRCMEVRHQLCYRTPHTASVGLPNAAAADSSWVL